jgi:hypothetical protein
MAFQAGSWYYFGFYATATGLTTSNFTVDKFTKDGVTVDTNTSTSLIIVEIGSGYYYAKYVPASSGLYVLALSNIANSLHHVDVADIQSAPNVSNLNQDTGGVNALKPAVPDVRITGLRFQPIISEYILMVFQSSDWQVGRVDNTYAVAMTQLDKNGNWLTTPLPVLPGTYHIIIRNNFGTTKVIRAFLEV